MSEDIEVRIERAGDKALAFTPVGVYAFDVAGSFSIASQSVLPFYTRVYQLMPCQIGEFRIVPNGQQNDYPEELRGILDNDHQTPEALNKQVELLWGQGPALYRVKFENGKRVKYWEEDKNIQAWLDSWDYQEYLMRSSVEFRTINGHFTKFYRNRAPRVGRPGAIAKLDHVSSRFARLEWPDEENQIRNIIVGNFTQPWKGPGLKLFPGGLTSYPIFDPDKPFSFPVSMRYSNLYGFALDYEYSRSPLHGIFSWIKLSTSIPKILTSFNANSMTIKYHIEIPAIFWDQEKATLQERCMTEKIPFTEALWKKHQDKVMENFTKVLAGNDQVGKYVQTSTVFDESSNQYVGFKITPLDQKVKDYIEGQLMIAKEAIFQVTAGIGLHPALSNLSKDGNLPSGSEQLYAFKLYKSTSVDIPEGIITKDLNMALRVNFPESGLRLGFYHENVMTEEATSPQDRLKNQGSGTAAQNLNPS